jgi:hypothetical protein
MMNYSEMAAALGREIDKMFDEARDIASKAVAAERERCMREIATAEDADARKDIARVLKYWLDNNERQAAAEGRAITPATHVMPTEWPDRGTLANWIAVLRA